MTIPDFITWLNTNINTNGIKAITGAKLNTALVSMMNFIRAEKRTEQGVAVLENTTNIITFKNRSLVADPFPPDTELGVILRCYDTDGNNVDYRIFDITVDGFKITTAGDASIDYLATEQFQTIPT